MSKPYSYPSKTGVNGKKWEVRYTKPDGRSTRKRGFATKRDAEAWHSRFVLDRNAGEFVTTKVRSTLMGPLIDRHLALAASLKPTTVAQRRSTRRTWVIPQWAHRKVGTITQAEVQDWIQEMSDGRAGPSTIEKAHGYLYAVLKEAVATKKVPSNVADGVKLPRAEKRAHPYLSHEEVAELVAHVGFPQYRTLVAMLAYTGVRFGEAAALRVNSLNLAKRRIMVSRAVAEVGGKLVEGTPKTWQIRTVPIPKFLIAALRAQTKGKRPKDLLFTSAEGGQLRINTWRRRYFYTAIDAINVDREEAAGKAEPGTPEYLYVPFQSVTPHDLRHTAASLAVASGANVKAIQRMLGHANAAMTLNTYADLFDSDLDEVADALDEDAQFSGIYELLA